MENVMPQKTRLDRALSLFTDVRPGEAATAVLMLANIFLLLVCYSVIKTVREPLILLGGGAEVRSYAAAGQALALIAFVPAYAWLASRVNRARLLMTVSVFFIGCIELFAVAVAARTPYVGVAFFIWVGVFNMSLVAQFWSFANDVYNKESADRLFPIIAVGMTAGAPLGSLAAGQLFRAGATPSVILQIAAVLLAGSVALYMWIDRRERGHEPAAALPTGGGFQLVLANPYLRLVAVLMILLNVVNTTGEYMVAKLLTIHVNELAHANAAFDKQAFIGAFSGQYQFWVNISALLLQAFVTSRLIKHSGLRGALLALPLIALGGYAVIAAGVGFSVVRWVKTAENATDYSIMNTARQLLWVPTSREEKYKAKQAIDTFFVRFGDVLSALVVYAGATVIGLSVQQFALVNVVMTVLWLGVAMALLGVKPALPRLAKPRLAGACAAVIATLFAAPTFAQDTREAVLAREHAEKAAGGQTYQPDRLEKALERVDSMLFSQRPVYTFIGGVMEGGGLAVGPGYRKQLGDTGRLDMHAAWSIRNYKAVDGRLALPTAADGRIRTTLRAKWMDAPNVAFYGTGIDSSAERTGFAYRTATAGADVRVDVGSNIAVGGGVGMLDVTAQHEAVGAPQLTPMYGTSVVFAEFDSRTSPDYSRRGGLYRVEMTDYRQVNDGDLSFQRVDVNLQQFVPLMRENWVIALRALGSATSTASGNEVPYFLMPNLGGSTTLRGYSTWRFRDRNRLLLTGEWRWTAGSFVDMALFIDAGTVAPRVSELDWRDMKRSYGIGMTLHTFTSTITRLELARTTNGTSVGISFSPNF
jgi:ATP:ADP antiporter, AAA family